MGDANLSVEESNFEGKSVLVLTGDIDAKTAPVLKEALEKRIAAGQTVFILNFSGVSYISSAGIGVLNAALTLVKGKGGDIVLAGVSPVVRDTMEVMYFTKKIRLYKSVPDAAKSL